MVYIRGHAFDYDRWQAEGCDGWSYADCLPYFKKAQNHCLGIEIFYTPNLIKVPPGARNTQLQNLDLGIYTLENCKQHRNEHDH